ncbi:unnamed protein product, partial [Onchocerca flexuosa]|uniref:Phage tail protein n=1 Tax=Onchocerca flexuosa TaxID=387005 RepID=A0A183HRA4_9BILA
APLFGGIINFDSVITDINPSYNDVVRPKQYTEDMAIRAMSIQTSSIIDFWIENYIHDIYNFIVFMCNFNRTIIIATMKDMPIYYDMQPNVLN